MKTVDYVEYKHSYAHALRPKLKALNMAANVDPKPVEYLKAIVREALSDPQVRWTEKETDFFMAAMGKADSKSLYRYCRNAVKKAKTILVQVDDQFGELIRP